MSGFGAVDVQYFDGGRARAAAVRCSDARFESIVEIALADVTAVEPYRPGEFWRRELPAIRAVLADWTTLELLIIDGYVDLDPDGRPGLGAHAHDALRSPVIGVAKTAFHTATHAIPVRRGAATRPLYVTAVGLRREEAAEMVARMAGRFRLPDALRTVDALARRGSVE
ncbi:MAG TPA: endonuclease V [Micromonosporaceae bacterium]